MEILLILPGFILAIVIMVIYEIKLRKPQNNVHFYVARDKNGELFLYMGKPFRGIDRFHPYKNGCIITSDSDFHYFGLNKNDYSNLKWEDKPIEAFINIEE